MSSADGALAGLRSRILPTIRWDGVHAAQRLRCGACDAWFTHCPLLGNEVQYVLLLPFVAWYAESGDPVDDGRTVRQLLALTWVATFWNNAAKDALCLPRPPRSLRVAAETVDGKDHVTQQYGFPSTHSAAALGQAYLLAREGAARGLAPPSLCWGAAAAHVAHVCFSRLYMGVHAAADIVGGLAIAAVLVGLHAAVGEAVDAASVASGWGQLCTVALSLALLSVYPDTSEENTAYTEALALAGLHLGACLSTGPAAMHAFPRLTAVPGTSVAASYVVGLVALGVFRQLLSVVSKAMVRSLPKGGGGLASPAVARPLVVSLITASYLLTLHPTQLVAWVA